MVYFFKLTEIEQDRASRFRGRHSDHSDIFTYAFTVKDNIAKFNVRITCSRCNKSELVTEIK